MGENVRARQLDAFQQEIAVPFRNPAYLDQALTHSSFVNEALGAARQDNQRLEFLGDAVLDMLVGEWLFRRYPTAQEGELTNLRAHIVRTETLAEFGREIGIGSYLRMGRGEAASGGSNRDANLCAAVEALVGAIYIDRGLEATWAFVLRLLEEWAEGIGRQRNIKNAKSYLQEHTQAIEHKTPLYRVVDETGPDHAKVFVAEVLVGDETWGEGSGSSKQAAEQAAAQDAITRRGL